MQGRLVSKSARWRLCSGETFLVMYLREPVSMRCVRARLFKQLGCARRHKSRLTSEVPLPLVRAFATRAQWGVVRLVPQQSGVLYRLFARATTVRAYLRIRQNLQVRRDSVRASLSPHLRTCGLSHARNLVQIEVIDAN